MQPSDILYRAPTLLLILSERRSFRSQDMTNPVCECEHYFSNFNFKIL